MVIEQFKAELPEFREETLKFYAGEVPMGKYKGYSGKFGSYAQKGGKASMVRLRMAGGRLTKDRLKFIADMVAKHNVDLAKLTTCETVQLHNLQPEAIFDIMESAIDVGIITYGGGGDFPRNIMMSPLSGVESGEYFDVVPYVEAAGAYLLEQVNAEKMPRKLKVCFSTGPSNVQHATFRDLGFVAREDGLFDVYSAGGLGNNPKFGVQVAEGIRPSKILFYIKAMRNTFIKYGNYENRGKARTRYMVEKLGEDGYVNAYRRYLADACVGEDLTIDVKPAEVTKRGDGSLASGKRVINQKQYGLYAVSYHPIGGLMPTDMFGKIYEAIKDIDDTEVRIGPDETIYVINLTGDEAKKVLAVTEGGAETEFEHSVSCIGSTICQVGVRDSNGLLHQMVDAVREAGIKDGALPRIHVSGCPSSCGSHQTNIIGFRGAAKKVNGKPQAAFMLFYGGNEKQGKEAMGEEMGNMLPEEAIDFMLELGKTVEASGKDFAEWIKDNDEAFRALAAKYTA